MLNFGGSGEQGLECWMKSKKNQIEIRIKSREETKIAKVNFSFAVFSASRDILIRVLA